MAYNVVVEARKMRKHDAISEGKNYCCNGRLHSRKRNVTVWCGVCPVFFSDVNAVSRLWSASSAPTRQAYVSALVVTRPTLKSFFFVLLLSDID